MEERVTRVLTNVIQRAFGELNNIFQDEFSKILSQQSTKVRFFLSQILFIFWIKRGKFKSKGPGRTDLAM